MPGLLIAAVLQTPAPTGTIEVLVQTAENSAAVAGVYLELMPAAGGSSSFGVTDGDGRRIFSNLTDGTYEVRGGLQQHYILEENKATAGLSRTATLTPASRRTNVTFRVNPAASISGKITNAAGQPLSRVSVAAASPVFRNGRAMLTSTYSALTGPGGEYRLAGVFPGTYVITATPPVTAPSIPLSVYFPGVANLDSAQRIPIRAGEQVQGIDFVASTPQLFKVSGRVLNPPATGVPNITFAQRDRSTLEEFDGPLLTNTSANASRGEFEVMLPAGAWDIFPVITNRTTPNPQGLPPRGVPAYTTGRVSVDVADRSVDGVNVTVGSTEIKGRIIADSSVKIPGFSPANIEVRLFPTDNMPPPLWDHLRSVKVGSDGQFTFTAVPPGAYRIQFAHLSAEVFVSDIRASQTSVFNDAVLKVTTELAGPVEVVLSAGGGTIQASLQAAVTAPGSTGLRTVVLVPQSPRRENILLYRLQAFRPDEREFRFFNVPPGQYKLFAFEDLPAGKAELNAEFMSAYEALGEPVAVTGAGTVRASVRLIEARK